MTIAEYVSVTCMFAKILNMVLFYQINVLYAFVYGIVCLCKYMVSTKIAQYKGSCYVNLVIVE